MMRLVAVSRNKIVARPRKVIPRSCMTNQTLWLLSSDETAAVEPLSARGLQVRVPHDDQNVRLLDIFVCRDKDGTIRAYENHCPHAGGPLNLIPDRFFMRDSEFLMCTRHAALFSASNGVCMKGPCAGDALRGLPISVDQDGVRATVSALREAVAHAFIIVNADSEKAAGPAVQSSLRQAMPRRP